MIIDVVDMTEEEISALSLKQILILRNAQAQKEALLRSLEEDKVSAKLLLLANNMARSTVYDEMCARLEETYREKLEELKEKTAFNVANSTDVQDDVPFEDTPYLVDYNLSMLQRVDIVQSYYLSIEEPHIRMRKYAMDNIAKKYLGDYYAALYAILEQYSSM